MSNTNHLSTSKAGCTRPASYTQDQDAASLKASIPWTLLNALARPSLHPLSQARPLNWLDELDDRVDDNDNEEDSVSLHLNQEKELKLETKSPVPPLNHMDFQSMFDSHSILDSDFDLDAELSSCADPHAYMQQLELEANAAYQEYLQQHPSAHIAQTSQSAEVKLRDSNEPRRLEVNEQSKIDLDAEILRIALYGEAEPNQDLELVLAKLEDEARTMQSR